MPNISERLINRDKICQNLLLFIFPFTKNFIIYKATYSKERGRLLEKNLVYPLLIR